MSVLHENIKKNFFIPVGKIQKKHNDLFAANISRALLKLDNCTKNQIKWHMVINEQNGIGQSRIRNCMRQWTQEVLPCTDLLALSQSQGH